MANSFSCFSPSAAGSSFGTLRLTRLAIHHQYNDHYYGRPPRMRYTGKYLSSFPENDLNNNANSCTGFRPMIFFAQIKIQHRRYTVPKTTLMTFSLILAGVSVSLFIYWLRYTCQLILSAKSARDYTRDVAEANNLLFLQVQEELAKVRERFDL